MGFTATVFDTETPGFTEPGIMQLAAITVDEDCHIVNQFSTYIIPELYTSVETGAFKAHGITMEECAKYGIPLNNALAILKNMVDKTDVVVCHNYAFDSRVVNNTLKSLGKSSFLEDKKSFCTMEALTPVCKLAGKGGKYKWPKLIEAHEFLFGEGFFGAHDALNDVKATVRILNAIKKNYPNLINLKL